MTLTAISLFAGVGGFDLAAQYAGIKTTAAVEIDDKSRGILAHKFPEITLFNDVRTVTSEKLLATGFVPERGVIFGGFPCQDLSIAGKRAGLAGERSGLFYEIVRLLKELTPKYFVLENVPGLLSSNRGRDMGAVLTALVDCGYGVAYRVLDAQFFGVPQRRRRVFIVGCFGDDGRSSAQILAIGESLSGHTRTHKLQKNYYSGKNKNSTRKYDKNMTKYFTFNWANGGGYGKAKPGLGITEDGVGPLSTSQVPAVASTVVRRLTPTECERLQGFPDGWTAQRIDYKTNTVINQKDSVRYKQMGNAVAVPCVTWILQQLNQKD